MTSSTAELLQTSSTHSTSVFDRQPRLTLAAILALYLAIACVQAAHKLLWADELFTLSIARQGSLAAIWRALAAGADPNPPLSHWLVLQSTRLLGLSALAVRFPSILCIFAAICSLWSILRRWLTPTYAALGLLAFMTTRGFDHAYNARSYAPLLAFSLAALALWLYSFDRHPTRRAVVMAVCLALAISSNYYGVLAFLPIAAGEAAHTLRTRQIRLSMWLALAAAALPILAYLPLIRHHLAEFGPHAWNRPHPDMLSDSYLLLVEGLVWPVLALAIYTLWKRPAAPNPTRLAPHELTAVTVLLIYPFLGYAVALLGHGIISPRCVIPVCAGFAIAAALLAARTFGPSPRAALALITLTLVWVVARETACFVILSHQRTAFFELRDRISQAAQTAPTQPIVISDSLLVLPLAHYSPDLQPRLIFPIDFAAIHASEPDDSGEQNLWAGRNGVFPVRIVPYRPELLPARFLLISRPQGWLPTRVAADAYRISPANPTPWPDVGGISTPLAHTETRLLTARIP